MRHEVGDRVLCVYGSSNGGRVGTVISANGGNYVVEDDNGNLIGDQHGWSQYDSFVPLPKNTRPLKREDVKNGAKVVYICTSIASVPAGAVGIIYDCGTVTTNSFYVKDDRGQMIGSGYWVETKYFQLVVEASTVGDIVVESVTVKTVEKKPCPSKYYGLDEPCTCGRCPPKRINAAFIKI